MTGCVVFREIAVRRRCSEHDHAGAQRPVAREQGTLDRESPDASAGRGVANNERMTRDATAVKGANAAVTIPRRHVTRVCAGRSRRRSAGSDTSARPDLL